MHTPERLVELLQSVNAAVVGDHIAGLCSEAAATIRRLSGAEPDYCVDPELPLDPQPWGERHELLMMMDVVGEPIRIGSLIKGPDKWAVSYLIGDGDGNVEGREVEWFDDEAKAQAYAASLKLAPAEALSTEGDPSILPPAPEPAHG